jgi:Repeat of unknown function (DUF5648)
MPSYARRTVMPEVPAPLQTHLSSVGGPSPIIQPPEPPADTHTSSHITAAQGTPATTALLRAYSPTSGDHFYTISVTERDTAAADLGYVDEGVACQVFATAETDTTPLLRVFNPASGDHFYTTSIAERDTAVATLGYHDEGIACHVFATAGTDTTPLLRVFNPDTVDHFYTTSATERDTAVATLGYQDEGIACHVYP